MGYVGSYNARHRSLNVVAFVFCLVGVVGLGLVSLILGGAWAGFGELSVSVATPSTFVMFVAWPIVHLLMGVSLYVVYDRETFTLRTKTLKNTSIALFVGQFLLVLSLPFLLYKMQLYTLTFVISSLVAALLSALIIINLKVTATSSVLLLPCLAWIAFETYLTLIIAMNNF